MQRIERVKGSLPNAAPIPVAVMVIHGLPGRKLLGQHPPLGAGFVDVEDGVDEGALGMDRNSAAFVFGFKMVRDELPLFVGEVTVVHELISCVRFIIYLYDK